MQPESDAQLLRAFAERGAEAAFTGLVRRHTNLVYSAALRQVESPDVAVEVAQMVFINLARGAKQLAPRLAVEASLAGWLCRSARNLSLNHRRDEFRRRTRERLAMEQLLSSPDAAPDWERLSRVLDDAMAELNETDYDALVLRYFQNQDFRTVGTAIGVSDDTAQKRVARALEKLRDLLSQRGIRTTAGALGIVITANAVQAAPVGLALAISTAAMLTGTTLVTIASVTTTKAIAMTTFSKILIGATLTVAIGTGIYQARQSSALRGQVESLKQQRADELEQLKQERDAASARMLALQHENERANSNSTELLRLRSELSRLRSAPAPSQLPSPPPNQRATQTDAAPAERELPKDSWKDVGFANVPSVLQTRGWAVLTGNRERFKESIFITPEARQLMEKMLEDMIKAAPAAERKKFSQMILDNDLGLEEGMLMPMMAENQTKGYTGYQILAQQEVSPDETILQVATKMTAAPTKTETLRFRRFGNDWKLVVDEQFIKGNR